MHWSEWICLASVIVGSAVVCWAAWFVTRSHYIGVSADEPLDLGPESAPRPPARVPIELSPDQRCPYCHEVLELTAGLHECPECGTVAHWECNREMGCPTLGCSAKFETRPPAPGLREGGDPKGGK